MDCPNCGSTEHKKDGFANGGKQRYKCKQYSYHYTAEKSSWIKSQETKELALKMYIEGMGFRSIGRVLRVSNTAVLGWMRPFGKEAELQVPNTPAKTTELDKMHTFVGKKNYRWVWFGVDRDGHPKRDASCGRRWKVFRCRRLQRTIGKRMRTLFRRNCICRRSVKRSRWGIQLPSEALFSEVPPKNALLFQIGGNNDFIAKTTDTKTKQTINYSNLATPEKQLTIGPQPGWYLLGTNDLYDASHDYDWFHELTPVKRIGYSISLFHVTLDDANRLREQDDLPQLYAEDFDTSY